MVFYKGHPGFKPKGSKARKTLEREQRRALFEERISEKWEDMIDKLKPEYVADQFMGKAPDIIHVKAEVKIDSDIAEKNNVASSESKNNRKRQA